MLNGRIIASDAVIRFVLVCMSAMTLPAQQIGTAGRLQDLDFARAQLPQLDPFSFAQLDPARFQAAADALSASAPTMTDTDFYVGLAQLIAMAGDPHTSLFLTGTAAVNTGFHQFPLTMHWLDDGVFVTGAADPYSRALGAQLVRVGNVPIEQVVARLATVIPHVNDQWVHYMAQQYLTVPALLQGLGVVPEGPTSSLTFQTLAGDVFTMDVAPADAGPQSFVPALSDRPWIPRYLQGSRLNYWLKYEADNRLLYFKYNSCADMASYPFSTFASDLMAALDSNPVDTLVLDFRGNLGGNSALFSSLTDGLAARMPALAANPNFRVYDAVDMATISSGLSAAMSLEDPQIKGNAVLRVIGEPTGGAGQGYGNGVAFTLPASNLTGQYATKFIQRPPYISSGDSFVPDITYPCGLPITLRDMTL